jgi:adenosine/AMP kinase
VSASRGGNYNGVISPRANRSKGNRQPVLGVPPKGLEAEPDIEWRKNFLRQIGYKL